MMWRWQLNGEAIGNAECECDVFYSTGNCAEGTGQCECRPEFQAPLCDSCSAGYYGYPQCRPCDCNASGTRGNVCEVGGGQCPCKPNYAGFNCDQCAEGYFNFPECTRNMLTPVHGQISDPKRLGPPLKKPRCY